MQFKVGDKELLKIQSYRCKDSFKDLKINNEDYIKLNVIHNKGEKNALLG